MSIFGSPIGNGAPRADWAEADQTMASFIRNKPEVLEVTGGTLAGNLAMNGNAITGLPAPTNGSDAATKAYVDGKRLVWTAQIPAEWENGEIEIPMTGMLQTDMPHVMPSYSGDKAVQREAWSLIGEGAAASGKLILRCFEEAPTIALTIQVEVMR